MKTSRAYHLPEGGWGDMEITIAPIGRFIPLHEFDPAWAMFFSCELRHYDTFLPTEIVVRAPELVQPRRGRIFSTEMYLYGDKPVDSNWLSDHCSRLGERFDGTASYEAVVLVEVYSNHGDDGHTNYELVGYRFVGEKALEARNEWRGTMDVMIDNMPGDHE